LSMGHSERKPDRHRAQRSPGQRLPFISLRVGFAECVWDSTVARSAPRSTLRAPSARRASPPPMRAVETFKVDLLKDS